MPNKARAKNSILQARRSASTFLKENNMIRYTAFCKIVEYGSFTRAAEALGYTQAAVSQMIRSLENEFSLRLLIRTRSGVRLTREGEQMYPLIRKFTATYRELSDRAGEINGLDSGEIRIGTISSMSQHLLPGLMSDFNRLYPKINFVLSQGDNTTQPEWINSGIIDFGFVYPEASAGLINRPIVKDVYLTVLPEDHPYAEMEKVPLALMAKEPLIIIDEGGINTVLRAFSAAGLTPRINFRIHDDFTILSMVEKGIGVSILPSMILDRAPYRIKTLPTDIPVTRRVGIAYRDYDMLPMAAKKFLKFVFDNIDKYLPKRYLCLK